MGAATEGRRIRSLRPPRPAIDPWQPIDVVTEEERLAGGGRARVLTVFLAGSECPFTCVFCDLWRFTLDGPTPAGAIPAQIEQALERAGELPADAHVKLYNASNFFDPRAVPPGHDPEILALSEEKGAQGVIVAGICCTANEILMRQGAPVAGNFMHQELAIATGACDLMLVDVQCMMPALSDVVEHFHTKLVTTSAKAKITMTCTTRLISQAGVVET